MNARKKKVYLDPVSGKELLSVSDEEFLEVIQLIEELPLPSDEPSPEVTKALKSLLDRHLSMFQINMLSNAIKRLKEQSSEEINARVSIKQSTTAMVRNMDMALALLQRSTDSINGALR